MHKKRPAHKPAPRSAAELRAGVEQARDRGRFQQALEQARQLYKLEPTPANLELLKEVALGRARQLRHEGHGVEAANTLEGAVGLDQNNPHWLQTLAKELTLTGQTARAMAFLERLPQAARPTELSAALADGYITATQLDKLPAEWKDDRARVLTAFAQIEKGDDEAARATLQGIGLRSPFLEWKVFLRGLQAYYQNDDARALENWQRLDPERAPARLAAPFRARLEPAFAAAQPVQTQQALQQQYERLQGSGLVPGLKAIALALAHHESVASAFRQAEVILPTLRLEAPRLVPRLAACFYWAVIDSGPESLLRYQRVFGKPTDDPNFNRLRALAYDRAPDWEEAHLHWQIYEAELAANPALFGASTNLARALIWLHLGNAAAELPTEAQIKRLPAFLRDSPLIPPKLDPPAETCFRKSIELAPDLLDGYEALVEHLLDLNQPGKAEKVAHKLLDRFPDHVATLEQLAELRLNKDDASAALELLQRALKHNPLDRDLRFQVGLVLTRLARTSTLANDFKTARDQLQNAQELVAPGWVPLVLCQRAACELKAGDPEQAEAFRQQALAGHASPLLASYLLLTEAIRLKLPAAVKKRYEQEFKAGLAGTPDGQAAAELATTLNLLESEKVEYTGQKTHTSKILTYVGKCANLQLSERQYLSLCASLLRLNAGPRALSALLKAARSKYPETPEFPLFEATAGLHDMLRIPAWVIGDNLQRAANLIAKLPAGERRDSLMNGLKSQRELLDSRNPFLRMFDNFTL